MAYNPELTERMEQFSKSSKHILDKALPVIIRLEHRGQIKKQTPDNVIQLMKDITLYLCRHVKSCIFGYSHSNEVVLLLNDQTNPWLGYRIQEMCSSITSMASKAFLRTEFGKQNVEENRFVVNVFNIPKEYCADFFYWRQMDAKRKSVSGLAAKYLSHEETTGVLAKDLISLLKEKYQADWYALPSEVTRGFSCERVDTNGELHWKIITKIPIFTHENTEYIHSLFEK